MLVLLAAGVVLPQAGCGPPSGTLTDADDSAGPTVGDAALAARVESYLQGSRDRTAAGIRAVLVALEERSVLQHYRGRAPVHADDIGEITTSIVSILIGIALADGTIDDLDARLPDLLPRRAGEMSRPVTGITLRNLLAVRSGLPDDRTAWQSRPDAVGEILAIREVDPPGQYIKYSRGGAHLLAAVLAEASGMPPLDYARSRLLEPLGIGPTTWTADRQGVNLGYGGWRMPATAMLRVGQLMLGRGTWLGRALVPAAWVRGLTTGRTPTDRLGYTWWLFASNGRPAYAAAGRDGQTIEVVPDLGLVVAVAAGPSERKAFLDAGPADSVRALVSSVIIPSLPGS